MERGGQPGGVWRCGLLEAELCEQDEDTLAFSGMPSCRHYAALFHVGLPCLLVVPLALALLALPSSDPSALPGAATAPFFCRHM
jgi:hypothetical protein